MANILGKCAAAIEPNIQAIRSLKPEQDPLSREILQGVVLVFDNKAGAAEAFQRCRQCPLEICLSIIAGKNSNQIHTRVSKEYADELGNSMPEEMEGISYGTVELYLN